MEKKPHALNHISPEGSQTVAPNRQVFIALSKSPKKTKHTNAWNTLNGSRRDRIEIMAQILCCCHREKLFTKIMYANNLNYSQAQDCLRLLTSRQLLRMEGGKYVTTEKGFSFLELFEGIRNLLING